MNSQDIFMKRCIELALKGSGNVAPNPMVGCVIVHKNKIIGEGYHEAFGGPHAEVNAINSVEDLQLLKKATLYVNLEPCSHYGKTPPCADLIAYHKIPYVVIGSPDSNPEVKGKGIQKLVKAGVDVKIGVLEDECRELNKRFFTFHEKKRPYVILKWAQSKDGFVGSKMRVKAPRVREDNIPASTKTEQGQAISEFECLPEWISNESSRRLVHQWRAQEQAIMVGTNTALADNPKLTVRHHEGKNPLRIVLDKNLNIPPHYHLLDKTSPTLVFTEQDKKAGEFNLDFIKINFEKEVISQVIDVLYQRNITSLFVEGGTHLINSLIEKGYWDEIRVFTSPLIIKDGTKAPRLPATAKQVSNENILDDKLIIYRNL